MQEILDKLNAVRGVGGCLVLSRDGLPMASALRQGADENALAAALATAIDHGQTLGNRLDLGAVKMVQSLSVQGGVLVLNAGNGFLAIVMDPGANLALLQIEARPFAERVAQRLTL